MAFSELKIFTRLRQSTVFDEWISRCEETIQSYLCAAKLDALVVTKLFNKDDQNIHSNVILCRGPNNLNSFIMGKLHKDMMFLEKLANHPELKKDLLDKKFKKKDDKGNIIDCRNVCGTAKDGLSFLHVRKEFWETSEPSAARARNRAHTRETN